MGKKLTKEEFVKRSREKHGNKYDYSKTVYFGIHKKLLITCPFHGDFYQIGVNHTHNGHGCPECGLDTISKKTRSTNSEFSQKARLIHGDRYKYDFVDYQGNKVPVKIFCKKHGIFKQRPNDHLMGSNCPTCSHPSKRSNTKEFIEKSVRIHGDKYDYSRVKYVTAKRCVEIVCPHHGSFFQMPNSHLTGSGCSICSQSYGEETVNGILESLGVCYDREVTFDGCVYKNKLRFDFEIKHNGQSVLIEYDGEFHYIESRFRNSKRSLKENRKRDAVKDKFCKDSGIPLIRIPYTVTDIENYLVKELTKYIPIGE